MIGALVAAGLFVWKHLRDPNWIENYNYSKRIKGPWYKQKVVETKLLRKLKIVYIVSNIEIEKNTKFIVKL